LAFRADLWLVSTTCVLIITVIQDVTKTDPRLEAKGKFYQRSPRQVLCVLVQSIINKETCLLTVRFATPREGWTDDLQDTFIRRLPGV